MHIKRTFKSIGLVLGVILLVANWLACTKRVEKGNVLKIWNWNVSDEPFLRKMFKEFEEEHPGIKIQYTCQVGGMYDQMLSLAFKVGEPPDMFLPTANLTTTILVEKGWVIPYDSCAPNKEALEAWKAQFPPKLFAFKEGGNVINGKTYTFPFKGITAGGTFYYNKTLFRKAGLVDENGEPTPPRTWSEFRRYARIITQAGKGRFYGFAMGMQRPWVLGMNVTQLAWPDGHPFVQIDFRKGRYCYDHPNIKRALRLLMDIDADGSILPGAITMTDETAKRAFATDNAAMIIGGPWNVTNTLVYNPDADFDVAPPPHPDDVKIRCVAFRTRESGGGFGYLVSSSTKHRDMCWELAKFFVSRKFQKAMVKAGVGVSIYSDLNTPENFAHPAWAKIAKWGLEAKIIPTESLAVTKVKKDFLEPVHPNFEETLQGIWVGKLSMDALDKVNEEMNAALERAILKAQQAGVKVTKEDFIFPDWIPCVDYLPAER